MKEVGRLLIRGDECRFLVNEGTSTMTHICNLILILSIRAFPQKVQQIYHSFKLI